MELKADSLFPDASQQRSRKSALLLLAQIDLGLKIKRGKQTAVTVGIYSGNHGDGKLQVLESCCNKEALLCKCFAFKG